MAKMTVTEKADLLDWISRQERLRIETWYQCGGKRTTSVWTIFDDEDTPSGKAPTTLAALRMARLADGR